MADCAPFVGGLKVTMIVHVTEPASDLPQVWVKANCPEAEPFSAMLVAGSDRPPQRDFDLGCKVRQVFSGLRWSYAPEQL